MTALTTLPAWRPGFGMTAFDDSSNYLGERIEGWIVYCMNRDSDSLTRSNYESILKDLKEIAGDSDGIEEHDFGHWAVGWVRQIILTADAPERVFRVAERAFERLTDYPVYNDEHWSALEYEEAADFWDSLSPRAKVKMAMESRARRHWLAHEPVWIYGRKCYAELCEMGCTISEDLLESLRPD